MTGVMRKRIVDEAMRWLGTPYHHQGRVRGAGVDCLTLLCEVYHACDLVPYIDPTPYPPDWHFHRNEEMYLGGLEKYSHEVNEPQIGDVLIWKFARCFSHGGIWIGNGQVIHSYLKQGCVIANVDHEPLKGRAVKYFSVFGGE